MFSHWPYIEANSADTSPNEYTHVQHLFQQLKVLLNAGLYSQTWNFRFQARTRFFSLTGTWASLEKFRLLTQAIYLNCRVVIVCKTSCLSWFRTFFDIYEDKSVSQVYSFS